MKFILLDATKDKVLVPNKVLPSTFRLLLSHDVKQLATEDLEIRRLNQHPQYPNWQCCLVRTLSTQPSVSLISQFNEQEISLSFKSSAALEPELDFETAQTNKPTALGHHELVEQRLEIAHKDSDSRSPLTALDSLEIEAEAKTSNAPSCLPHSLEAFGDLDDGSRFDLNQVAHLQDLSASLAETLRIQIQVTESLLSQHQAKLSQIQQKSSDQGWSKQQVLGSLLLDEDYPTVIEESTNWVLSVRTKILERLKMWSGLSNTQKEQVQTLMEQMKVQNLDIAKPPAWLLDRESCAKQATNYQNFISTYEEIDQ